MGPRLLLQSFLGVNGEPDIAIGLRVRVAVESKPHERRWFHCHVRDNVSHALRLALFIGRMRPYRLQMPIHVDQELEDSLQGCVRDICDNGCRSWANDEEVRSLSLRGQPCQARRQGTLDLFTRVTGGS